MKNVSLRLFLHSTIFSAAKLSLASSFTRNNAGTDRRCACGCFQGEKPFQSGDSCDALTLEFRRHHQQHRQLPKPSVDDDDLFGMSPQTGRNQSAEHIQHTNTADSCICNQSSSPISTVLNNLSTSLIPTVVRLPVYQVNPQPHHVMGEWLISMHALR